MGRQYSEPTICKAIEALAKANPQLFDLENPVPLQIGIRKELRARYASLPGSFLTAILGYISTRDAYLERCTLDAPRYGFEGPQGTVSERESRYAANRLSHIRRHRERKAQRVAA